MKKKNVCGIGGQAVLEGVMMRGRNSSAIAVREQDGNIAIESERIKAAPAVGSRSIYELFLILFFHFLPYPLGVVFTL